MRRRRLRGLALLLVALMLMAGAGAAEDGVDLLSVDHRLYELGYRDGACSGVLDEVMVNALKNFQQANGLGITGEPDAGTVLVLLSDSAVSQADYLARLAQENAAVEELSAGDYGENVVRLERALGDLGYFDGESSGVYDDGVTEAVCRFQLANGLQPTGRADAAVFLRLYGGSPVSWEGFLRESAAAMGDSGAQVRLLQHWLRRKGYFEGESTGRYGESTQRAVRQFQTDAGLEASGDADVETCRALFGDVTALLADAVALRRGDAGAEELCQGLAALGYAAHDTFDMQTELALMQFQSANGIEATGVADARTLERLTAPDAVGRAGFVAAGAEAARTEDFAARVAQQASQLLGQMSGFDEEFGLVQYVYLKCGVAISGRTQFAETEAAPAEAQPGDVMVLDMDGVELCGVVAGDGGVIYRDGEGRIVMGYPGTMGAAAGRVYRLAVE